MGIPSQTQWGQDAQESRLQAPGARSTVLWSGLQVTDSKLKLLRISGQPLHSIRPKGLLGAVPCARHWSHRQTGWPVWSDAQKLEIDFLFLISALPWCSENKSVLAGTSLVVQWLRLCTPNEGGLGSNPGQGIRSHVLQLRVHMPQLKIPHATMKIEILRAAAETQCSRINKKKFLRGSSCCLE